MAVKVVSRSLFKVQCFYCRCWLSYDYVDTKGVRNEDTRYVRCPVCEADNTHDKKNLHSTVPVS